MRLKTISESVSGKMAIVKTGKQVDTILGKMDQYKSVSIKEDVTDLETAKSQFSKDGRVHFHSGNNKEMTAMYELEDYLKKEGIEYGETNVTPEQYTIYDVKKFNSDLKKIKESKLKKTGVKII